MGRQPARGHTSIGKQAVALISSHIIDAGALVEAGVGSTFIDVSLAVRPCRGWIREDEEVRYQLTAEHTLSMSPRREWVIYKMLYSRN